MIPPISSLNARFLGLNVSGPGLPSRSYAVISQSGGDVPGQQYWNDRGGSPANGSGFTLSRCSTGNTDGLPENLTHVSHGASTNQIVQSFGYIYDKDRVTKTTREGMDTWKYACDAKSLVAVPTRI